MPVPTTDQRGPSRGWWSAAQRQGDRRPPRSGPATSGRPRPSLADRRRRVRHQLVQLVASLRAGRDHAVWLLWSRRDEPPAATEVRDRPLPECARSEPQSPVEQEDAGHISPRAPSASTRTSARAGRPPASNQAPLPTKRLSFPGDLLTGIAFLEDPPIGVFPR